MARTYKAIEELELRPDDDLWDMFALAERVVSESTGSWGSGQFQRSVAVEHVGSKGMYSTVAEARADTHRTALTNIFLMAYETGGATFGERQVTVSALFLERKGDKSLRASVEGPDEHTVIGLSKLVVDELKAAHPRTLPAPLPAPESPATPRPDSLSPSSGIERGDAPAEHRWWDNVWVVGIGVTVIGTLLAAAIIALL